MPLPTARMRDLDASRSSANRRIMRLRTSWSPSCASRADRVGFERVDGWNKLGWGFGWGGLIRWDGEQVQEQALIHQASSLLIITIGRPPHPHAATHPRQRLLALHLLEDLLLQHALQLRLLPAGAGARGRGGGAAAGAEHLVRFGGHLRGGGVGVSGLGLALGLGA